MQKEFHSCFPMILDDFPSHQCPIYSVLGTHCSRKVVGSGGWSCQFERKWEVEEPLSCKSGRPATTRQEMSSQPANRLPHVGFDLWSPSEVMEKVGKMANN